MEEETTPAIEKLRSITNWAGWMNETFNYRVKTISDWEKLFDYAEEHDIEFIDDLSGKHAKAINKILGYEIL